MGNKLYVGNLPYSVRDADLEQAFSAFGSVTSAKVMMERDTGRSKGFGFVEMGSDAEAAAATQGLNMREHEGRTLTAGLVAQRPLAQPFIQHGFTAIEGIDQVTAVQRLGGSQMHGGRLLERLSATTSCRQAQPRVPLRPSGVQAHRWPLAERPTDG